MNGNYVLDGLDWRAEWMRVELTKMLRKWGYLMMNRHRPCLSGQQGRSSQIGKRTWMFDARKVRKLKQVTIGIYSGPTSRTMNSRIKHKECRRMTVKYNAIFPSWLVKGINAHGALLVDCLLDVEGGRGCVLQGDVQVVLVTFQISVCWCWWNCPVFVVCRTHSLGNLRNLEKKERVDDEDGMIENNSKRIGKAKIVTVKLNQHDEWTAKQTPFDDGKVDMIGGEDIEDISAPEHTSGWFEKAFQHHSLQDTTNHMAEKASGVSPQSDCWWTLNRSEYASLNGAEVNWFWTVWLAILRAHRFG